MPGISDLKWASVYTSLFVGQLYIYFESPDEKSSFEFKPNINNGDNVNNGDELTVELKIYEDRFYTNYTVNGNTLYFNVLATFDGSTCGFDYCEGSNYRQKEQYEVPVHNIGFSTLNDDAQGCSVLPEKCATVTNKVQIWSLED